MTRQAHLQQVSCSGLPCCWASPSSASAAAAHSNHRPCSSPCQLCSCWAGMQVAAGTLPCSCQTISIRLMRTASIATLFCKQLAGCLAARAGRRLHAAVHLPQHQQPCVGSRSHLALVVLLQPASLSLGEAGCGLHAAKQMPPLPQRVRSVSCLSAANAAAAAGLVALTKG